MDCLKLTLAHSKYLGSRKLRFLKQAMGNGLAELQPSRNGPNLALHQPYTGTEVRLDRGSAYGRCA